MEPENLRRLHVIQLCKKYRKHEGTEPIDVNPQQLHKWLNDERFDTGRKDDEGNPIFTPLYPSEIATIVNYCYYRGEPAVIGRILANR